MDGALNRLADGGGTTRLTGISIQMSVPPQSQQCDLSEYEGRGVMVQGHDGGGWIYDAHVIDHAGPILTAVVKRVFASGTPTA